jgi:threonyl-tRNA synthetase
MNAKVPAVLVVGDDDVAGNTVGFRLRGLDEERGVDIETATDRLLETASIPSGDA